MRSQSTPTIEARHGLRLDKVHPDHDTSRDRYFNLISYVLISSEVSGADIQRGHEVEVGVIGGRQDSHVMTEHFG